MVQKGKLNNAIRAIHDLIIQTRSLAYHNHPYEELAAILDEIEYLPALILEEADRTDLFEQYLESICTHRNFPEILNKYNFKN